MKLNGRPVEDYEIAIDVQKAVQAYDIFKERYEAKGNANAVEFDKALKSVLTLLEADFHLTDMVLGSKQTLSGWQTSPPKLVKRSRSVLIAVLAITGLDISTQGILGRQPLNFSPMSELAPLRSHKLTNDPEEISEVVFEVELAELLLKVTHRPVMSDWLVKPVAKLEKDDKPKKPDPVEIGTVVMGLNEADILIDFGETVPEEWTRRISAETDPFLGRADGCVVLWKQERKAWIVQPTERSPMRVRLENVKLCKVRGPRGATISLAVAVVEDQLNIDFNLKVQIDPQGKPERSQAGILRGDQLKNARERLFSIVLGHRLNSTEAGSVLSYQRLKLP
jgi:hypothetical protein